MSQQFQKRLPYLYLSGVCPNKSSNIFSFHWIAQRSIQMYVLVFLDLSQLQTVGQLAVFIVSLALVLQLHLDVCLWPMEFDRVQDKGYFKGKGKGKKGKDSFGQKGKGKDGAKGKGNHSGGKGGKGKDDKSSKARLYCGKLGHFKRDCRMFLYDQKNGNVRQVEEQNQHPAATDNASQSSTSFRTSQPGASSSSSSHVRRVELAPLWNENDRVDDLDINFI